MMKQMRENTKIILWIVVVAFVVTIFAVWGLDLQTGGPGISASQGTVGKVNGEVITRTQYQAVYNQVLSQFREASPNNRVTYAQQELAHNQAWDNLVIGILTEKKVQELGIEVTDQEIVSYLRNSPPPEIRQYFLDENGNFDFAAYRAALNNPEADWTAVEALARQRIPLLKLNQYLTAQVHVSTAEVQQAFEEQNTQLTVEYVEFPIPSVSEIDYEPTEEEIRAYYDENPDEYTEGERAVVEYVRFPVEPTPRDLDDLRFTIGTLRDQILQGEDFAALAESYSTAATAASGGLTGFIPAASQRDSAVVAALDRLEPEEVSEPIETSTGVYLVQLVETSESEETGKLYNFRELYMELEPGTETYDSVFTLAQDVHLDAIENGLESAAETHNVTIQKTSPFIENYPIPGIGFVPSISRFAFNSKKGALSQILSDQDNYYICRLAERIPEGVKPYDEVKQQVIHALKVERAKDKAERLADAYRLKLVSGKLSHAQAAEAYGYSVQQLGPFTAAEPVGNIGPYSPFAYAALSVVEGETPPTVLSGNSYYVLTLTERSEFDLEAFKAQADAIHSRLLQQRIDAYIAYWYEELKEESEIEDYRAAL